MAQRVLQTVAASAHGNAQAGAAGPHAAMHAVAVATHPAIHAENKKIPA